MAILRVGPGAANNDGSGVTTTSLTSTAASLTAGNTILVGVGYFNSATITASGITDTAGNTYAQVATVSAGGTTSVYLFAATNVLGNAANVVTIPTSAAVRYWQVLTVQYSGLVTSSVVAMTDLTATGTVASNATVVTGAWGPTTQADELLFAFGRNSNGGSSYTASTYPIVVTDASGSATTTESIVSAIVSGSGNTTSLTYSTVPGDQELVFAAFKAAAAGGGTATKRPYRMGLMGCS